MTYHVRARSRSPLDRDRRRDGRRLGRSAAVFGLSALMGLSGLTLGTATPAAAAPASAGEVTIPAPPHATPATEYLYAAGTGVQTYDFGTKQRRWQSLADGRVAHDPACSNSNGIFSGDTVACAGFSAPSTYTLHDYAAGTTAQRTTPEGHEWAKAHSRTQVLSYVPGTTGGADTALHLLGIGDNAPADVRVAVPGRMAGAPKVVTFDDKGAVVTYYDGEAKRTGLVDFATARLLPLPQHPDAPSYLDATLSADWVVLYDDLTPLKILLVSREDGVTTRSVTITKPGGWTVGGEVRVLGDWLVVAHESSSGTAPLRGTSLSTGTQRTVLPAATRQLVAAPDGTLYAVGGADSAAWGVQRITLDASGLPTTQRVIETPPNPAERTGPSLAQGQLSFHQDDGRSTVLQGYDLPVTPPLTVPQEPGWSRTGFTAGSYPTGDGRMIGLDSGDDGTNCSSCVVLVNVTDAAPDGATRTVRLQSTAKLKPAGILGASGRYVHFLATENSATRSVVADIETGKVLRVSGSVLEALWGGKLWIAGSGMSSVSALDLATGKVSDPVSLEGDCTAPYNNFQVVGDWLHRSCGYSLPGQVFNLRTGDRIDVPANGSRHARLGDGFLAYAGYGMGSGLKLVDFRSGTAVTEELTTELASTNAGQGWTVDRFGSTVAFVDEAQTVHLVTVGGDMSPLTTTDVRTGATLDLRTEASWQGTWWLSKPAASWQVTVTDKATGRQVHRASGGEARGVVAMEWSGKDAQGARLPSGTYTWRLSAIAADGVGSPLARSGDLKVIGASKAWHDFDGADGIGDLLAVDSTEGAAYVFPGAGDGTLAAPRLAGTSWPRSSTLVPFGDMTGDGCNDVLVRKSDGTLWLYEPKCGGGASIDHGLTRQVGSGWTGYTLISSGDMDSDGIADLLARSDANGELYRYSGTASGGLSKRVKIGWGWSGYTLIGSGDLNGDGHNDVLGRDSQGRLNRYDGKGDGTFGTRTQIGWGWSGYTMVGVGDLNGDGTNDVVGSDPEGRLLRYDGTGEGTLTGRTLIGEGWSNRTVS
ncbi:FG-GAP-like repeat-containing protein [Streptomyces sp. CC228A]|uniref:FG-GAP-like repeat-containing protein n=1 Tax=Streptomyces sp. CC228A TaxID=2898186 RepID=UPI001F2C1D58|nr:FG-GAP-like repeat-containing protein [Streptomyces sp. CC228A]